MWCKHCGCSIYYDRQVVEFRHTWTHGTECAFNVPNPSVATPIDERV
jgi:hypothetical protein